MTQKLNQSEPTHRQFESRFRSDSYDEEENSVEIVIATDSPIGSGSVREVLEFNDDSIDKTRLDAGAFYLLNEHSTRGEKYGRLTDYRIENGQLIGRFLLSSDPAHSGVIENIKSGVMRHVSVGFMPLEIEEREESGLVMLYVKRWAPFEVSLTAIPADVKSRIRSDESLVSNDEAKSIFVRALAALGIKRSDISENQENPSVDTEHSQQENNEDRISQRSEQNIENQGEHDMTQEELAAERTRTAEIFELVQRHELPADFATRHIKAGSTLEQVRADAFDILAERSAPAVSTATTVSVRRDEYETFVSAAEDALSAKMAGKDAETEAGRSLRNLSTVEIARRFAGAGSDLLSKTAALDAALSKRSGMHTTSDFAAVLGNATNRTLRRAYDAAPRSFTSFVSNGTISDFRPVERISLGDAPKLQKKVEGAEYKYGTVGESAESYKLATYGRALSISRNILVNDDLNAFARTAEIFGRRAAELESDLVYDILLASRVMSDGKQLFHNSHGNLINDVLSVAGLSAARAKMRKQKGIDGGHINVAPTVLIVGPNLETEAQQLLAPISATVAGEVNPFVSSMSLAVDSRIEGNQFFLSASPALIDTIELSFLDGAQGVQVRTVENIARDGVDIFAQIDVAAAPIDWRGLLKSTGSGS